MYTDLLQMQELKGDRGLFEVSTPHLRPCAKSSPIVRDTMSPEPLTAGRFPSARIPNTRFQTNSLRIADDTKYLSIRYSRTILFGPW